MRRETAAITVASDRVMNIMPVVILALFVFFLAAPLISVFIESFRDGNGHYVGLANYVEYFSNSSLSVSIRNSLFVGAVTTVICVPLAFLYAYCLTHTCVRGKAFFSGVTMIPLLAPSLLPAMALIYLFGRQGLFNGLFDGAIYGPQGICLAQVYFCFPAAVTILVASMRMNDARLYEASEALGASGIRTFLTVVVPACRYGLISACFVVFTLVTTDFGIPKIIGGNYSVLSTDIYKQVVGQQNFQMGAVVGVVLLVPSFLAFGIDQLFRRKAQASFSGRSVLHRPKPSALDLPAFCFCLAVSLLILIVIGVAAWASFIKFWPYNLSLSLNNYNFDSIDLNGWASYYNSIKLAVLVTVIGTPYIFFTAYLMEKSRKHILVQRISHVLAMIPVATPGMILGLGYIGFFNAPANPLSVIFGSITLMALNTVVHFYTVPHLIALTALKKLDGEIEIVSDSLRASRFRTMRKVTLPLCNASLVDIAVFLFVNSMTTVAAVIFLYASDTKTAAVAAISYDDSGIPASALAMGMMIFYTCAVVQVAGTLVLRWLDRRQTRYRQGAADSEPPGMPALAG
jgi:iron(III) transport system permease protein